MKENEIRLNVYITDFNITAPVLSFSPLAFSYASFDGIGGGSPTPKPITVNIRKEFPETWIWDSFMDTRLVIDNLM